MSPQNKYYHKNKKCASRKGHFLPRSELFFKSQTKLKEYLYEVANKYYNEIINNEHDIYGFMNDMFDRHPTLSSVDNMEFYFCEKENLQFQSTRKSPNMLRCESYRCYYRLPKADKWYSFSIFKKCVVKHAETDKTKISQALRHAINYQIDIHRTQNICVCKLCNDTGYEVDHIIPFKQLRDDFILLHGPPHVEKIHRWELVDSNYTDLWEKYHYKHATLQFLCCKCHNAKTFLKRPEKISK